MHWLFLIDRKWLFLFDSTWLIQPDANNEIDFDSLPDPDVYLQKRYIYESYKAYMKFRNKKMK